MFGTDLIETKISTQIIIWNFHNYPRKIYTIQFDIYNYENYYFKTRIDDLVLGKNEDKIKREEESGEKLTIIKIHLCIPHYRQSARKHLRFDGWFY